MQGAKRHSAHAHEDGWCERRHRWKERGETLVEASSSSSSFNDIGMARVGVGATGTLDLDGLLRTRTRKRSSSTVSVLLSCPLVTVFVTEESPDAPTAIASICSGR